MGWFNLNGFKSELKFVQNAPQLVHDSLLHSHDMTTLIKSELNWSTVAVLGLPEKDEKQKKERKWKKKLERD